MFHLAERADELEAAGLPADAARREARRRFGNFALQRERTRDANLIVWLETCLADLRYAVRAMASAPGFALVSILSLAFGVGANTAIFTLINVTMLKALPVDRPDELVVVTITATNTGKGPSTFTQAAWEQIRDHHDAFSSLAAYGATGSGDLSTGGESRPVTALYGVEPNDPLTMASAIVMLTTVAFGASLLPARRAARFDPIVALRHD
jgi:putative ABC transport system permease protein